MCDRPDVSEPPRPEEEDEKDEESGNESRGDGGSDYQKILLDSMQASQDAYDKYLISLSSGALSLSLLFLDKLIDLHEAIWKSFLFTAWFAWAVTICATVWSFYSSQCAFEKAYNDFIDKKSFDQSGDDRITRRLNIVSGTSFVTGVVFLILFVVLNLICSN